MIKFVDYIIALAATPEATELPKPFTTPEQMQTNYQRVIDESKAELDAALNDGYSVITATPVSYSGITQIVYLLHKRESKSPVPPSGSETQTVQIVAMTAGLTKNSQSPMWRCVTSAGQTVNVFKHADPDKNNFDLFMSAGYAPEMLSLPVNKTLHWEKYPITVLLSKPPTEKFWNVVSVEPRPPGAKPNSNLESEIPF
jgi:hypothetical protein